MWSFITTILYREDNGGPQFSYCSSFDFYRSHTIGRKTLGRHEISSGVIAPLLVRGIVAMVVAVDRGRAIVTRMDVRHRSLPLCTMYTRRHFFRFFFRSLKSEFLCRFCHQINCLPAATADNELQRSMGLVQSRSLLSDLSFTKKMNSSVSYSSNAAIVLCQISCVNDGWHSNAHSSNRCLV